MRVTIVRSALADVDPGRSGELVDGFGALVGGALPDGLVRTELLRDKDWDMVKPAVLTRPAALTATREAGERPVTLVLFERLEATHTHEVIASTTT